MRTYPDGDGIFMDISFQLPSISSWAKTKMEAQGLDWTDARDRAEIHRADQVENTSSASARPCASTTRRCRSSSTSATCAAACASTTPNIFTHLEIESLPTAGWGYEHFPVSARYVDPLGIPFLGMTGKFHTTGARSAATRSRRRSSTNAAPCWRRAPAARSATTCTRPAASTSRPWAIIAPAYKWVAEREAWAEGSTNRAEIAVLSRRGRDAGRRSSAFRATTSVPTRARCGCCSKASSPSTCSTSRASFRRYRLLILPDAIPVGAAAQGQDRGLSSPRGGRVLLTGRSGIERAKGLRLRRRRRSGRAPRPTEGGDFVLPIPAAPRRLRRRSALHVRAGRADHAHGRRDRSATSTIPISTARRGTSPATSTPPASPIRPALPAGRARAGSPISPSRSSPATSSSARSRCWRSPRSWSPRRSAARRW